MQHYKKVKCKILESLYMYHNLTLYHQDLFWICNTKNWVWIFCVFNSIKHCIWRIFGYSIWSKFNIRSHTDLYPLQYKCSGRCANVISHVGMHFADQQWKANKLGWNRTSLYSPTHCCRVILVLIHTWYHNHCRDQA